MRAGSAVAAVVTTVAALAVPADAARSFLVQTGPTFQRVGGFLVDSNPTYAGALRVFGGSSSCRVVGSADHAIATWQDIGATIELRTYGALPSHKTGCTAPGVIKIDSIRLTSRHWHTSRGLNVGDRVARLRQLYPRALKNPRGTWPRPNAYWLVTRRTACLGKCRTRFVRVPQLLAEVREGHVAAFYLHVGAEGD